MFADIVLPYDKKVNYRTFSESVETNDVEEEDNDDET